MKAKAILLWGRAMLSRRIIIKIITNQLKNISRVEHSRYLTPNRFIFNMLTGLVIYCLKENKPTLYISNTEMNTKVTA